MVRIAVEYYIEPSQQGVNTFKQKFAIGNQDVQPHVIRQLQQNYPWAFQQPHTFNYTK